MTSAKRGKNGQPAAALGVLEPPPERPPSLSLAEQRRLALLGMVPPLGPDGPLAERARAALTRLDDGSYGFCTRCGLRIPDAVLLRTPERAHCSGCDRE